MHALGILAILTLRIIPPNAIDDDLRGQWRVVVSNPAPVAEKDVPLHIWATSGVIVSMPAEVCAPDREAARCTIDVAPLQTRELTFTAEYGRRTGTYSGGVSMGTTTEYDTAIFGRDFVVTNANDEGAGSLRQAIHDANRDCAAGSGPCVIAFRLPPPVPAEGFFTIRPRTALPPIAAAMFVDGESQTLHTGDTHAGPEIRIDGSDVSEGHGLVLTPSSSPRVEHLEIANFPGNGIESSAFYPEIRNNTLRNNGGRGVQIIGSEYANVMDNVLSFNGRAGGFFWTANDIFVRRNEVIGNGASGLFFHRPSVTPYKRAIAADNVIAHNRHAGIGLSMAATGEFGQNTFRHNASLPIDVGLDGDTRETLAGLPGQGGRQGAPVITSARFDGTDTIVEMRLGERVWSGSVSTTVWLYTNDELLTRFLPRDNTFTVRIARDLRGQSIRAAESTIFIYNWDYTAPGTSELSEPVAVE
ncbi:MAG TPA: right-handed parallel beta-helix repeat-containing protein [Thermoanaerobaculia bacterium]|nr:right-handed parallel beta-helix repeat-containing protein [Thermoanaerobaculia bacterium]